ncbi:Uncharacterised protein [Mycobacteroides abscessus subsp. abscessus]|nr:Uncharacterised protein [Mycobacteroides abscessus subsp. abscessus]
MKVSKAVLPLAENTLHSASVHCVAFNDAARSSASRIASVQVARTSEQ